MTQEQEKYVELSEAPMEREFVLLTPGTHLPRQGQYHGRICTYQDLPFILAACNRSRIVAVDFETRGGDYSDGIAIVGIGLAWDSGSAYFDWHSLYSQQRQSIRDFLLTHRGLIAHNIYFDGGVVLSQFGQHADWYGCTYALLAQLLNEGYPGESWGLKSAQVTLLGWGSSNEVELDQWLVVNGYYVGNRRKDESPEYLQAEYLSGNLRPDKGEMWRAPISILGKYCCLDAEACYLLFTEVLEPVLEKFPELMEAHQNEGLNLIKLLIEQKMYGIPMDRPGLLARREIIQGEIADLTKQFLEHPDVSVQIHAMETLLLADIYNREPEKYLKEKPLTEPPRLKKSGEISKNWLKWKEQFDERERTGPTISKNWLNWDERRRRAECGEDPDYRFNLQSGPQLRELMYDRLHFPVRVMTEGTGTTPPQPGVGIKALKHMGEPGNLLVQRMWFTKELSYIDKYLELTEHRPTIHPSFRTPGTVTGRLSSKEPNLQQVPKTKAVMSLFVAPPGKVWVDLDFCLHPDTEYLTPTCWKKVTELTEKDQVWQVDPATRTGSWVTPSRIVRRQYTGSMYSVGNRRGSLRVTENHRMLWSSQINNGKRYRCKISEVQNGIPTTGLATMLTSSSSEVGRGYCPTYQEMNTVCLLQADSYFDGEKYHIQLAEPEKRKEACYLLGKESAVYPPREFQNLEVAHWWNIRYSSPLLKGKSLYLDTLDSANADALVSCLEKWDGSTGRSGEINYHTSDPVTADQVQRYLVRCDYECKIRKYQPKYPGSKLMYALVIRRAKGIRLRKGIDDTRKEHYSGLVGCVTVPTGCILVRSGGQTFITGNCALESVVAAEFSEDPNLLILYGDNVPENDIHLFVAASVPGEMGDAVRATGYRPVNPPPGTVSKAKKEAKKWRSIAKTVVYACIEEGTPIRVLGRGLVPIQEVRNGDQVWDGIQWVITGGSVDKGTKPCYYMEQVRITDDHRVLDSTGEWRVSKEFRTVQEGTSSPQPFRPKRPSASWSEVWEVVCSLFRRETWR